MRGQLCSTRPGDIPRGVLGLGGLGGSLLGGLVRCVVVCAWLVVFGGFCVIVFELYDLK